VSATSKNRGKSKFERISWDEAATIIANEIKRNIPSDLTEKSTAIKLPL
jgi:anaerobic selenocysteine-containing dehydrogenase